MPETRNGHGVLACEFSEIDVPVPVRLKPCTRGHDCLRGYARRRGGGANQALQNQGLTEPVYAVGDSEGAGVVESREQPSDCFPNRDRVVDEPRRYSPLPLTMNEKNRLGKVLRTQDFFMAM